MRKRRPAKRKGAPKARRTLTVDHLNAAGEGMAGEVRIPFTLPGETVDALVSGKTALPQARENDAEGRAAARCPHFGLPGDGCGGCTLQHLGEAGAELKAGRLLQAMRRVFPEAQLAAVHRSPERSRRRAKLSVHPQAAGFHALHSNRIVGIESCAILRPEIFDLLEPFRSLAKGLGRPFDVQVTLTDTGVDGAISGIDEAALDLPAREKVAAFADAQDLARLSVGGVPLAERRTPMIALGGIPVAVPPGAFLQATEEGQEALTGEVLSATEGTKAVADLFCGLGTFALPLSQRARVVAFDAEGAAIASLGRAAKAAGRPVETEARDLFARPLQPKELSSVDAVVFDPPRAGAAEQAPLLAEANVPVIVAVSCNPASLARDAAHLAENYRLERLALVDQFGWSPHVEAVAVFRRR